MLISAFNKPNIKNVLILMTFTLLLCSTVNIILYHPQANALACGVVNGSPQLTDESWAQGKGVASRSNGPYDSSVPSGEGTGIGCGGDISNLNANPPQYGIGWQCVELAQRMYNTNDWYSGRFAGVAKAADIYTSASSNGLTTMAQGSIILSNITPGDMIITSNNIYGHVMLVDSVNTQTNQVLVVDQNGSSNGRKTLTFSNGSLSYSSMSFSGVVHSPNNQLITGLNDIFQATGLTDYGWRVSYDGTNAWQSLKASTTTTDTLMIGDFDNDGYEDDILQASGVSGIGWRVSMNGNSAWQTINGSTTAKSTLMVGDFNNDGYMDDVFQATGLAAYGWRVSMGGNTAWTSLLASTTTLGSLMVGDFDSDGYIDDILQASGVVDIGWRVSYNGTGAWQPFNTSMLVTKDSLMVGDFNHDGDLDDILQASGISGTGWRVSTHGTSAWQIINSSTTTKSTLMLGDFDGDGHIDDVFQATGLIDYGWRVSINGNSSWTALKASTATKDSLMIGDF